MQFYNLPCKADNNSVCKKLIMFFAGWGMDYKPFQHITSDTYDIIIIYDYTNCILPNIFNEYNGFNRYDEINIIAWSMGVCQACIILDKHLNTLVNNVTVTRKFRRKLNKCIAINGTMFPISTNWGIPQNIYDKTIDNIPAGLGKFNLRMCGSKSIYEKYLLCAPFRSTESVKQELIAIKDNFILCNSIEWNKVIISTRDNIFPTKNQMAFWNDYIASTKSSQNIVFENNSVKIIEIDEAHYPFFRWNKWDEIIEL